MAERDPQRFLKLYPGTPDDSKDPVEKARIQYLRAKALASQGKWMELEPLVLDALAVAVELEDSKHIAGCNLLLADIYNHTGHQERCLPSITIALETAKNARDNIMIAECLSHLARYHMDHHDRVAALKYYTRAIRTASAAMDPELKLKILFAAGSACREAMDYTRALEFYSEAMETAGANDDPEGQIMAIDRLSTVYTATHRLDEAESILRQGLSIPDSPGGPISMARLHFSLGCVMMNKSLFKDAIGCFEQCRELADSIAYDDPNYRVQLNSNLAGCYRYLNDHETALRHLELAEQIDTAARNVRRGKETMLNKANLLISIGRYQEAKVLLLDVSRYFSRNKMYQQLAIAKANLAQLYELRKEYPRAISTLKELNRIYSEHLDRLLKEQAKEHDIRVTDLLRQNERIRQSSESLTNRYRQAVLSGFVGSSAKTRKVLESALAAAHHPGASVLITGESGTGKEVVANLIHVNSIRSGFPFVAVNVSAISPGLVESEIFGHRKGSFTGATSDHTGFFEQANRGTLYLDEIADMPLEMQSKLLRVLETRQVTPVGGTQARSFDCRIISSSNRNISRMIENNSFRLDLYHRLNTIEIHIPPLRERPEDIPELVDHYVRVIANEIKVDIPRVEDSFIQRLVQHRFPGNVRELRNVVERLLIMLSAKVWNAGTLDALPSLHLKRGFKCPGGHVTRVREMQANDIIAALQACNGKQKDAARRLGMSEPTLTRRIKALHLEIYTRKGR